MCPLTHLVVSLAKGLRRGAHLASAALLASLCSLAVVAPVAAQSPPKLAGLYEDKVGLGFTLKAPDWGFVPAQSHEVNTIGKYSDGSKSLIKNPRNGQPLEEARIELLKFDRRQKADDGDKDRPRMPGVANFAEYAKAQLADWRELERKEVKVDGLLATRLVLGRTEGSKEDGIELALLVYVYPVSPDLDLAVMGLGLGDKKKWGKWEGVYDQIGKSFKRAALDTKTANAGPRSNSLRDVKRFELEQKVAANPGWQLFESPNYFVVTSKIDDKQFIDELMERLEAIREVYEEIYPVSLVKELRLMAKERENTGGAPPTPQGESAPEAKTAATSVDPMEMSKCSVVRICKDKSEYHSYGGPGGSAGYWSSFHQELVIYDDQASGGRRNTWATLNHEAFHQYIFYFLGNFAPHSWYNEGNGDFFSGYQISNRKFKLRPFDWRLGLIKENIQKSDKDSETGVVPLREIVRWTQPQYYGDSKYGTDGGDHYAQGWSFVYFLRTGAEAAKDWDPAYGKILDTYLRTLVETDDLDKAVDTAFAGIDYDKLEAAWKAYTKSL